VGKWGLGVVGEESGFFEVFWGGFLLGGICSGVLVGVFWFGGVFWCGYFSLLFCCLYLGFWFIGVFWFGGIFW
jgi:hypothetical protein